MKHCSRCGGTGYINGYSHVKGGVCFKCGGNRTKPLEEIKAEKEASKKANMEWKRKEKIRYEYPPLIAKKKEFLEALLMNDEPYESEEEKETLDNLCRRIYNKVKEMEAELEEARK